MQLSETVKLYLSNNQQVLVIKTMNEYIDTVNSLVFDAVSGHSISKVTIADVSALTNQYIRDARSIVVEWPAQNGELFNKTRNFTTL